MCLNGFKVFNQFRVVAEVSTCKVVITILD